MKLEKFNHNDGKGKRMFLYGFIMCAVLMILINLFFSQAKYLNTESIKIAEGSISYKPYDFKIMAMYVENDTDNYEEADTMPTSGFVINEEKSYCTIDNVNKDSNAILKTNANGEHIINNLSKSDKCYLYFDKFMTKDIILARKTISTRTDFSSTITADTTGTIYTAEDDDGTSYYFAGAPTDNWVKFAGLYWRIIRINGDGTIRMIYQGDSANTIGEGTQTASSAFDSNIGNNAYVGYMYTIGEVHGTGTSSTIKNKLDNWYTAKLLNFSEYIDMNSGFCGDRTPSTSSSSSNGSGGIGTSATYYGDYIRYYNSSNPVLTCANSSDLYTVSSSSKGNKALIYPIGLINMNEVWLGGGYQLSNNSYYLYTGKYYWTMSPCFFYNSDSSKFRVYSNGELGGASGETPGIRPVINLRSDVTLTGSGTITDPYIVS